MQEPTPPPEPTDEELDTYIRTRSRVSSPTTMRPLFRWCARRAGWWWARLRWGILPAGAPASTAPRFPPRETPGRRTTRTTAPPGLLRGPAPR